MNIFWFRRDLRLGDNRAFYELAQFEEIGAVYIHDVTLQSQDDFSSLHRDFIDESLNNLSKNFIDCGGFLNIYEGESVKIFSSLINSYNIQRVYTNSEIGSKPIRDRDLSLEKLFKSHRVKWLVYQNNGVVGHLNNRNGWSEKWNKKMYKPIVQKVNPSKTKRLDIDRSEIGFNKSIIYNVDHQKRYNGGEKNAHDQLEYFLNNSGKTYSSDISSPLRSEKSCSRLSPYITFGNLSIRQIIKATRNRQKELRDLKSRDGWLKSLSAFSSRLRWHCHFIQKLEMQPDLEYTNMVRAFDGMRDCQSDILFSAWKNGVTGYPMVDACMRFLKKTGWINFRMRAMLVSFASYNLWLDWRSTSKYLSKYFLDYEPGIHYNQFQMQSGVTGINSIRIYNPVKQQSDHDPDGTFVRRWCPELRSVPNEYLLYPHLMSETFQKKIGCIIGKDYSKPVVDIKLSALKAKKIIYSIKSTAKAKQMSQDAYLLHGSRRKRK